MDPLLSRSSSGALLHSAQKTAAGPAVLVAAGFIAAAIFVADTLTQLEIAVAVLYVAVILIAVRTLERQGVLIVAITCVALTILSYFLSREDLSPRSGFINCVISIAAIVVSTYLGGAVNGLSAAHSDFLAAGGLGLLIGDGRLNYGHERIFETYYAYALDKSFTLTADYQFIVNPAYNADRGPVHIFSGRLHGEF